MNLINISFALIGAAGIVFSTAYELLYVRDSPLWARILSLVILIGGCVGVIALIMLLLGIPLS